MSLGNQDIKYKRISNNKCENLMKLIMNAANALL